MRKTGALKLVPSASDAEVVIQSMNYHLFIARLAYFHCIEKLSCRQITQAVTLICDRYNCC